MSGKKPTKDTKKKPKTTPVKKKKGGHKPTKDKNFDINKIEMLASRGLIKCQIAACLDVSWTTFSDYQKEHPEVAEAYERGRGKGVAMVANKLMKNIESMDQRAIEFYLERQGGWTKTETRQLSGDVTVSVIDDV